MTEGNQLYGVVSNCDNMIPIPLISNNRANNALVVNNEVQTTLGITSTEGERLELKSPALF